MKLNKLLIASCISLSMVCLVACGGSKKNNNKNENNNAMSTEKDFSELIVFENSEFIGTWKYYDRDIYLCIYDSESFEFVNTSDNSKKSGNWIKNGAYMDLYINGQVDNSVYLSESGELVDKNSDCLYRTEFQDNKDTEDESESQETKVTEDGTSDISE